MKGIFFARHCTTVIGLNILSANTNEYFEKLANTLKGMAANSNFGSGLVAANTNREVVVAQAA